MAIEVAVFMAASRGCGRARGVARALGFDCSECGSPTCGRGHKGAREALRALADSWTALAMRCPRPASSPPDEAAMVWRDRCEFHGEQAPHSLDAFAACPALGTWVGAWLDGACTREPCVHAASIGDFPHPYCGVCYGGGLVIGPHLAAIEADLLGLWERASVECDCTAHTHDLGGCTNCGGLGRVRRNEQAHDDRADAMRCAVSAILARGGRVKVCEAIKASDGEACTAPARFNVAGRNACGRHRAASTRFAKREPAPEQVETADE